MLNFKGTCTVLPENPNLNDVIIFNGKTMAYTKKHGKNSCPDRR